MGFLLGYCRAVDWMNERIGWIADAMIILSCFVSCINAAIRYAFDDSSNAWLELQWYMFAVAVMLGASYTLRRNEHVRVDIVYMTLSERQQHWVDILGGVLFLLPACVVIGWLSWPFFMQSYAVGEGSSNAGGLLRWPIRLAVPVGLALLALQGVSEIIKRIAALRGYVEIDSKYERPTQ